MAANRLVLWHLPLSHYSEKARWALDYKALPHERHAPVGGYHMAVALFLTKGRHCTFPVIEVDGRRIGDSTAIIAALDHLESELGENQYLVGERFSVADRGFQWVTEMFARHRAMRASRAAPATP